MQTAALSLFRFDRLPARLWVLGQMALARPALRRIPGLEFARLCGSGTDQGFTPRPNTAVWAILSIWSDGARAREGVAFEPVFTRWRARASEAYTLYLEPYSARGAWGGTTPLRPHGQPLGAVAALTRATVRPAHALRFWRRVPDISARIGQDPNVAFKIGIGEVPFLHQVTFSVWPDSARMAQFARTGPHAAAIAAVRAGDWFSEELYARFRVTGTAGSWEGGDPLTSLELAA
jgi:spheroidene monooxygenase